jgi:hypothetical protein
MTDEERLLKRRAREKAYRAKHREKRRLASAAYNATDKGRMSQRAHYAKHRDRILARNRARHAAHPERSRAYNKASRDKHRAVIQARARAHRAANRADVNAKARASYAAKREHFMNYRAQRKDAFKKTKRAWVLRNTGAMAAIRFKRIAAERQALPIWADMAAIKRIYEEAARLTQLTGIQHAVDHIIPLQSSLVCGLHIAGNLQVLTSAANRQKGNHFVTAFTSFSSSSSAAA